MDEDGSGEISLEEFEMVEGVQAEEEQRDVPSLFANAKSQRKRTATKRNRQPLPRFFGASLGSVLGQEPPGSSTPAFVRVLMERLDSAIGKLTVNPIHPSRQAVDSQHRLVIDSPFALRVYA